MKITKGLPPPKKRGKGPKPKYEWGELQIGDSFTVDSTGRKSLFTSLRNYNKRFKTTIQIQTEKQPKGQYRCWRVE